MLAKTKNFLEEVKLELDKVTWPERREAVATAWVVVVIVALISMYLGFCDLVLSKIMRYVLS